MNIRAGIRIGSEPETSTESYGDNERTNGEVTTTPLEPEPTLRDPKSCGKPSLRLAQGGAA